jgi:hypothetical protein
MAEERFSRPAAVRDAAWLWVAAVAAGVVETIGAIAVMAADGSEFGPLAAGAGVRAAIYAVVLMVVWRFWKGQRWARWLLAAGLGVFGTLSLVAEPLGALATGHAIPALSLEFVLTVLVRSVHVIAVLGACVLMFRPAANLWFRAQPGTPARAG